MLLSRLFKGMKLKMFSVSSSCRAISCFSPLILVVAWCVNALASDSFDTRFEVDGVVTYQDRWMWDITMYMIRLNVQVRDGKSGAILANAEAMRPSLQRKSPEGMVEEVLGALFK